MIKIAYCIHKPKIGGAELHLLEVLRKIDRKRFQPILIFLGDGKKEALYSDFEALGIQIINLDMPNGTFRLENFKKIFQLAKTLREKKIDIIHGYLFEGNLIGVLSGWLAGVRVRVSSKRSLEEYSRFQLWASKVSNWFSTRITVVSEAVGDFVCRIEGCTDKKIVVIPNGVYAESSLISSEEINRLKKRWAIPENAIVVGSVARFSWKKGYQYFLETVVKILQANPMVYFVAFGDGPLKNDIEEMAKHLAISSNIVFAGWQSNTRSKMLIFDIYICTSVIEGMSNALLDAMAERRPVIATAVGGNRENIIDGVTGYLVPPADASAMADKILKLTTDPPLMRSMGEAGRQRVLKEYTVERMIGRMEELYLVLLKEKGILEKTYSIT